MRTMIAVAALVVAELAGLASSSFAASLPPASSPSPASPGAAAIPTCLITNGGGHGTFTKATVCSEVRTQADGSVGYGHYAPGSPTAPVTVTVTLQFQPRTLPLGSWTSLAQATASGVGPVAATTRSVRPPSAGLLRACTSAGPQGAPPTDLVCTGGN